MENDFVEFGRKTVATMPEPKLINSKILNSVTMFLCQKKKEKKKMVSGTRKSRRGQAWKGAKRKDLASCAGNGKVIIWAGPERFCCGFTAVDKPSGVD